MGKISFLIIEDSITKPDKKPLVLHGCSVFIVAMPIAIALN
ncbi:hypothetical protein CY0110_18447 [Crocosphaera chwakensis CCY0110]|uniref:Uncharacterized protein n=1 Tax=Crocosphaera chwakensis CCY0110 TaxID=391612 RepID=A3IJ21_9CHRO|nr:hypothetical protein CY0110_18447 [Crocosphaera chwakensis CCY0110]